jgi:hypothetical protein
MQRTLNPFPFTPLPLLLYFDTYTHQIFKVDAMAKEIEKQWVDFGNTIGNAILNKYGIKLLKTFVEYTEYLRQSNDVNLKAIYNKIQDKSLDEALEYISGFIDGIQRRDSIYDELVGNLVVKLSQVQFYKFLVCRYINSRHSININTDELHTIDAEIKTDARQFLKSILRNKINTNDILKDVFRTPKQPHSRTYTSSDYGNSKL